MNASWVAIDLMEFAVRTEAAVQSPEAALEWLRSFRDTLLMEGRNSKPMPWAVELLKQADIKIAKKAIARMQGQVLKVCGKNCNVEAECVARYGEKYTSLATIMNLTADAPHREAGDERQHPSDGELLESGTSANLYGAATTREGVDESTTGSNNSEARQSLGAGEVPPENVSKKPSPALPVLSFGEFGNIKMTNMQYGKLCERFSIADSVLAEADQYFEAQPAKKKKYKNHYAMLLNWCKRRETEAKPKQSYMTSDDISKKNYQESKARLEAMFANGRETA